MYVLFPEPGVEVGVADVDVEVVNVVDEQAEGETVAGAMHERALDMREGRPWHCEAYVGRPFVAVLTAVVYVAQNSETTAEDCNICLKQLSLLHAFVAMLVVAVPQDVAETFVVEVLRVEDDFLGLEGEETAQLRRSNAMVLRMLTKRLAIYFQSAGIDVPRRGVWSSNTPDAATNWVSCPSFENALIIFGNVKTLPSLARAIDSRTFSQQTDQTIQERKHHFRR